MVLTASIVRGYDFGAFLVTIFPEDSEIAGFIVHPRIGFRIPRFKDSWYLTPNEQFWQAINVNSFSVPGGLLDCGKFLGHIYCNDVEGPYENDMPVENIISELQENVLTAVREFIPNIQSRIVRDSISLGSIPHV
jgi:hypothetical protein